MGSPRRLLPRTAKLDSEPRRQRAAHHLLEGGPEGEFELGSEVLDHQAAEFGQGAVRDRFPWQVGTSPRAFSTQTPTGWVRRFFRVCPTFGVWIQG